MEYLANYDSLLRQMLGLPLTPWDQPAKMFNHKTLRDNVALLDRALLKEINALVAVVVGSLETGIPWLDFGKYFTAIT